MDFTLKIWLYLAFALAGVIGYDLWEHRKTDSVSKLVTGLILISLPLHMFEERIYPGGFHYIYGLIFPMTQTQLVMLSCNVTVLLFYTWLFVKKGSKPWVAVMSCFFGSLEFVMHLYEGIVSMQAFPEMSLPYSPGFIVTLVFMLPVSIYGFWQLGKQKLLTSTTLIKGFALMVFIAFTMVLLPNVIFNNSAYPFPNNGFYDAFLYLGS